MKIESPTPDPIRNRERPSRSLGRCLFCRAIFPVQRSVVQPLSGADGLRHQAQGIVEHRQARAVAMSSVLLSGCGSRAKRRERATKRSDALRRQIMGYLLQVAQ